GLGRQAATRVASREIRTGLPESDPGLAAEGRRLRQRKSVPRKGDETLTVVADLRQGETAGLLFRIQPQPQHPAPTSVVAIDRQAVRPVRGLDERLAPGRPDRQDD